MSLVENIARRRPSNRDILREVRSVRDRGYSIGEIARKFGMERMYISGIVLLIEHEEVALIDSVEAGKLPISVAVEIAHGKWSARLEMCQWRRETLDKESIWDEAGSTSLSRW